MANEVAVLLTLDGKQYESSLNRIENRSKSSGEKSGKAFSSGFNDGFSSIKLAATGIVAAQVNQAINSFTNTLRESFDAFRQFNRGIAEINSILPANAKLTREATNALIGFSSEFATGAQTQAQAFYNIVSAGVQGTVNQLKTLEIANKAATAGLVDIDSSAKLLVSSVNAYSKSGLTAQQASDALFVAVREGQTTFGELSSTLGNVTGIASSAGVTFSDLTGAVAAFTKNGLATSTSVNGLRQVIASVIKPTSEATKVAQELGLEFNTAALRSKGLVGFLKDIQDKTGGNVNSLSKLFGSVEALTPVLGALNGDFREFKRVLDATANSTGATDSALTVIRNSFDFKLAKRTQEFKNFFLFVQKSFIEVFGDRIIEAVGNVDSFANSFINIAKAINNFVIAPAELVFNVFRFVFSKINELAAATFAVVGIAAGKLGETLDKLGLGSELSKGLQTFRDSSNDVFQDVSKNANENFGKIFEGTIFSSGDEFLTNLENNLKEAKLKIDESEIFGKSKDKEKEKTSILPEIDFESNFLSGMSEVVLSVDQANDKFKQFGKSVRESLINGFSRGAGQAFAAFGAALAKGENALDAFLKSFLSSIGQQAVALGTSFILEGAAVSFSASRGGTAVGVPLIAKGAALAAFGGALSGASGGGVGGAGGGVSPDGTNPDFDNTLTNRIEDREEPETKVQINVQGDVFDSEETGLRLASILEQAQFNNNVRVV